MRLAWRVAGWAGGVLGAVATGAAVGAVAANARVSSRRRTDPFGEEPLGELPPSRESTVAADDGVPLSAEEVDPAGGAKPELTVVLVHGYALDRRCWHFQRRDLPELTDPRVRLVLYDQRSHGRSGRAPRQSCTIEQLGLDLDAVIRAMVPDGPIVLVGHSMGGMTIMALAEQRPQLFVKRVRAVALIATAAGELGGPGLSRSVLSQNNPLTLGLGRLAGWQPELFERARRAGGQIMWSATRAFAFGDRKVSPALVDLMVRMIGMTPVQVLTDFLETLGTHNRIAALAGLRHCEVLVIGGDADRLTPFSHAEVMAEQMPDGQLVRVPGAGHMVMLEQADLVTGYLAELVRRSAAGRTGRRRRWWKQV